MKPDTKKCPCGQGLICRRNILVLGSACGQRGRAESRSTNLSGGSLQGAAGGSQALSMETAILRAETASLSSETDTEGPSPHTHHCEFKTSQSSFLLHHWPFDQSPAGCRTERQNPEEKQPQLARAKKSRSTRHPRPELQRWRGKAGRGRNAQE